MGNEKYFINGDAKAFDRSVPMCVGHEVFEIMSYFCSMPGEDEDV